MTRRIVTGIVNGKSVIVSDGSVPEQEIKAIPGQSGGEVWTTPSRISAPPPVEFTPSGGYPPKAGETQFMLITFPPASVRSSPGFDPIAAAKEMEEKYPGFGTDPDHPGMHATPTIDYIIVLEGAITLQLEDGVETVVNSGDIVVQAGAFHGWRNHTENPVRLALILIGDQSAGEREAHK